MDFDIKLKSCVLSRGCENPTEAFSEVGFCLLLLLVEDVSSTGWRVIPRRRWALTCVLSMGKETCAKAEGRAQQWALTPTFANVGPACSGVSGDLCRALHYQRVLWEHRWINCKRPGDTKSKHNCICCLFQGRRNVDMQLVMNHSWYIALLALKTCGEHRWSGPCFLILILKMPAIAFGAL